MLWSDTTVRVAVAPFTAAVPPVQVRLDRFHPGVAVSVSVQVPGATL